MTKLKVQTGIVGIEISQLCWGNWLFSMGGSSKLTKLQDLPGTNIVYWLQVPHLKAAAPLKISIGDQGQELGLGLPRVLSLRPPVNFGNSGHQ